MLTVLNSQEGVSSKADETRRDNQKTRGNKGRKEVFVEETSNGFALRVRDVGNFGKVRWYIDVDGLSVDDLEDMRQSLEDLVEGRATTTLVSFEELVTESTETETETETEAEAVDGTDTNESDVVTDTEPASDMDELTA